VTLLHGSTLAPSEATHTDHQPPHYIQAKGLQFFARQHSTNSTALPQGSTVALTEAVFHRSMLIQATLQHGVYCPNILPKRDSMPQQTHTSLCNAPRDWGEYRFLDWVVTKNYWACLHVDPTGAWCPIFHPRQKRHRHAVDSFYSTDHHQIRKDFVYPSGKSALCHKLFWPLCLALNCKPWRLPVLAQRAVHILIFGDTPWKNPLHHPISRALDGNVNEAWAIWYQRQSNLSVDWTNWLWHPRIFSWLVIVIVCELFSAFCWATSANAKSVH
jgi:hypothetical protein